MGESRKPIRVLLTKVGLDGHDRGVKVVARVLRDAGMDVIYTGLYRTPEQVVDAAIQEDVDVLGCSQLSGSHVPLLGRVAELLRAKGAEDIILIVGGVIPDADVPTLRQIGVAAVIAQESRSEKIVSTIEALVAERGAR